MDTKSEVITNNLRLLAESECPHVELIPEHQLPQITEHERQTFDGLISREFDPNGGSHILVVDQDELNRRLDLKLHEKFALYFLSLVYSESEKKEEDEDNEVKDDDMIDDETSSLKENDDLSHKPKKREKTKNRRGSKAASGGVGGNYAANYALGVVRNSARHMPELIGYFATNYPNMTVKTSLLLNSKEINTLKISEYHKHVNATYLNGTYRYGPLLQASIVGTKNEEIGDYFPEFIQQHLETSPFLKYVMPWGSMSINENMKPQNSNDGPIIWAR